MVKNNWSHTSLVYDEVKKIKKTLWMQIVLCPSVDVARHALEQGWKWKCSLNTIKKQIYQSTYIEKYKYKASIFDGLK